MVGATGSKHCVVPVYGTLATHCGGSYKIKNDGAFVASGKYHVLFLFPISLHSSFHEATHTTVMDLFASHREKGYFELRITRSLAVVSAQKCLVLAVENRKRSICQDQYECPTLQAYAGQDSYWLITRRK